MASKGTALPTVSAASKSASSQTAPKATKNDNKANEKSKTSTASNANSNIKSSSAVPAIISPDSSNSKVSASKVEKLPSIGSANKTATTKLANNASKSKGLTELPASPVIAINSCDGPSVSNSSPVHIKDSNLEPLINIVPAGLTSETATGTEDNHKAAETTVVVVKEEQPIIPTAPVVNANNGKVKLIYEQYDEEFPIQAGSTTQENIDDVYCLSFVMPNCRIHLSTHAPAVKRTIESNAIDAAQKGDDKEAYALYQSLYLEEIPLGTYQGLEDDKTYYVYVEQEAEQLARDQEATRLRLKVEKTDPKLTRDDGRAMESCSCIYGDPCVDEYGCKDWDNRYAVAMKNGWKGF